ncbi:MAG: hypothetical protein ACYDA4_06920 [Ignavibacteriaceae bacterium]
MKKINTVYVISAFIITLLFSQIDINAQVAVVLQQPPPYQFKIENMWKVTLINSTKTTYTVYLRGVATESTQGQIVSATTASFSLAPGIKVVNSRELVPMSITVNNNKYADVVQNINAVPTGDYEICVSVINTETGIELGTQCMEAQTQNLSQVELLQPENNTKFLSGGFTGRSNDNINDAKIIPGSFITFNWLPPSPIPPSVKATYSLRIAEIFGNQSPYDAVLSNPAFYINQNIYSNIFLYPVEGRSFVNNRRYAWKVSAYLNNVLVSESETWEFTYTNSSQHNVVNDNVDSLNNSDIGKNSSSIEPLLLASTDDSQLFYMINEKENEVKPFLFSGNAKLSYTTGYKDLPFSEMPKNVLTAELNPSVAIYGLPFTANFLLSSQQGSDRQSINSAAFNFDINSYKEELKSRLGNKISELATGWEKLLLGVNAFGIGTNYPSYSNYTLNGVPVTGINVEVNPGIFYAAFTASDNQRSVENTAYQRSLYAGRIGIGKKDGTHLFFTALYAKDDENSTTVLPSNLTLTPKANYVFGTETKLTLFDNRLLFEGEGNAAVLTRDTRDADLEINAIPGFIKGMINPKISTSFDYSYAGKMSFNNPGSATRISLDMEMVGPGYISLGAPNLRNDQLVYEAKVDQGFFARKISIGTFFRTSHDNLIDWKSSTTTTTALGINLMLNIPKLPFLQVSYSPYLQKNDDPVPERKVENKTMMLTAVTGYDLLIKEFNFLTNLAYTSNEAKTLSGLSDYTTNSVSITEAISFNNPISFAGTLAFIKTTTPNLLSLNAGSSNAGSPSNLSSNSISNINNYDFSVNAAYTEFLSNTLGFNIATESGVNKKTGIYLNTTYSPWKNINLSARLEGSSYKDLVDSSNNYDELIFNIMVNVNW